MVGEGGEGGVVRKMPQKKNGMPGAEYSSEAYTFPVKGSPDLSPTSRLITF